MSQIKEQNKMPEKQLSEIEIGNIHGEEKNSENDCKDSKTPEKEWRQTEKKQ